MIAIQRFIEHFGLSSGGVFCKKKVTDTVHLTIATQSEINPSTRLPVL
jgi:hypothetical protein